MESTAENTSILAQYSDQLADAVARIGRSIVRVDGRQRRPSASGIVFDRGLVLTATHVLERDDPGVYTQDGRRLDATLVAHDPGTDLAVLRIEGLEVETPTVASKPARVGQPVLAVGRPDAGGEMASSGIVSTIGGPVRTRSGILLEKYITTDARPYPGFSGGALVDADGQLLGVLTSGLVGHVAVAIPADHALRVAKMLLEGGTVKRGFLGIASQPVELAPSQRAGRSQPGGLLVMHVEEGGPAGQAGVLIGDIVVGLDGNAVNEPDDLLGLLSGERVGREVALDVIRGGEAKTLNVVIGERSR